MQLETFVLGLSILGLLLIILVMAATLLSKGKHD
jgi:hypothetical protein